MTEHTIRIDGGHARFIYSDDLVELCEAGATAVVRVSHVEPVLGGGWTADMGPVHGPVLGPFATRAEGLAAERAWLAAERGL